MRAYESSHPWLTFELNLKKLDYKDWLALGEATSKCDHISKAPLRPDTAREMHKLYVARGALGTARIEGNTLTEKQVLEHLDGRLKLPPSKAYLEQEIKNIVESFNEVGTEVIERKQSALSVKSICLYNKWLLRKTQLEDGVIPGEIRKGSVGIVGARYLAPAAGDCNYLLEKLCNWLNKEFKPPDKEQTIAFGIAKAAVAHLYLAWIHPFGDGNGRTARLVEFQILLSAGVPTPAAHLLSNYYSETRPEYYRQLKIASDSKGNVIPFVKYAIQGFSEALRAQVDYIWEQHLDVTWRNYVYELFKDKPSGPNQRRRDLALHLSRQSEPVGIDKVRVISPKIAAHYAGKSAHTVKRDIQLLEDMKLVLSADKKIRANRQLIQSFLPARAQDSKQ